MSDEQKKIPPISIPQDAYEKFEQLAKSENKSVSQAVRDAMQEYSKNRGVEADFSVGQWGGRRDR